MVVQPRGWQVAQIIQTGRPTIQTMRGADKIRVTNRELFATVSPIFAVGAAVTGGVAYSLGFSGTSTYVFGLTSWLLNMAKNYDKYRCLMVKFVWQPIMPVTTGGAVAMWFDSDPEAATAPSAYRVCSGNMNAKTCAVFEPMEMVLRPDQLNRLPQYLTTLAGAAEAVTETAVVGNLKFAWSTLISANAALTGQNDTGFLWVDYDIELINPSNPNSEP